LALDGTLTLSIAVGRSGRVVDAAIEADTLGKGAAAKCLVREVKKLRFPRPAASGAVRCEIRIASGE
jgi:hypothetical protein